MARAVSGSTRHKKVKKIRKGAKGYYARRKNYKTARESVYRAWAAAFIGRKRKKRDFRRLWIQRINAAAREHGLSYSQLINKLKIAQININRKMLAELAVNDKDAFKKIVESVK